jgi:dihydrofolate reductase
MKPALSLIAAVDKKLGIGCGNALLWHCSLDQQHFKKLTQGHAVIMGRKTWDSLPERFRPLPGRRNIVLSRSPDGHAPGAQFVRSFEAAWDAAQGCAHAYVIGGAQVYALALPLASTLVMTEIDTTFDRADTFFPRWNASEWVKGAPLASHTDAQGLAFAFVVYTRKAPGP